MIELLVTGKSRHRSIYGLLGSQSFSLSLFSLRCSSQSSFCSFSGYEFSQGKGQNEKEINIGSQRLEMLLQFING